MINIDQFISNHIIHRRKSMFAGDMEANQDTLRKEIEDKKVLVIGGAGTIGSNFIKALLPFKPAQLTVVDISENGLTELTRDIRSTYQLFVPDSFITYPISYADPLFEKIMRKEKGFDIVANFSAHKHVRTEKDVYSVQALLENNVLRAKSLLDLLLEFPPKHFFCVSTDKAANPVNIMGASKKLMEELIMAYSSHFKVSTARFANVAFSNGSLLDGFVNRMMKRQVLVAPNDVKRYFVSPCESGEICLMACVLGKTGEIFFPKLNENQMMCFSDICDAFLSSQGYIPKYCSDKEEAKRFAAEISADNKCYPVIYQGSDTTGEKDFEEFYVYGEGINLNRFMSLGVIEDKKAKSISEMDDLLKQLKKLFEKPTLQKIEIITALKEIIPNFEHCEKGKYLDQKM